MNPYGEQSASDYEQTPSGWAQRWRVELQAAKKEVETFHTQGDSVLERFRDEKRESAKTKRVAIFTSNIQFMRCILYGRTPSVSVQRKWKDANADVARVAGVILERLLNADVCRDGDSYAQTLGYALDDRLLPGLGTATVRYEAHIEQRVDSATGISSDALVDEYAEVDYVHWKSQLWSCGSRVFGERRWWAYEKLMTKEQLQKRFGPEPSDDSVEARARRALVDSVPMKGKSGQYASQNGSEYKTEPWSRACVWEIWSKEDGAVYWYVDGMDVTLDMQRPNQTDGLIAFEAFWPGPRPMSANLTTTSEVPKADFILVQDTYNEIDRAQTRAADLIEMARVRGWYDKRVGKDISAVAGAWEGALTPVENLAGLSERGGIVGLIEWYPVDRIVAALQQVLQYKQEQEAEADRVSGIADIMRGQAIAPGATATEQGIKAGFGSVRMQALQDEFARFATDIQKLKAEVIAKRFSPETIIRRSGIMQTADGANPELVMQAVGLLKSRWWEYAIEVKPESINLTDLSSMRSEKQDTLSALGGFLQIAAPIAQQFPGSAPYLIELCKWTLAGTRGASTAEGIFDKMAEAAQQMAAQQAANPQPQQMDPKLQAQMLKNQGEQAKLDKELQNDLVRLQAETAAKGEQEKQQAQANVAEARAKALVTQSNRLVPNGRPFR
jgi:hypothetical protein